MTWEGIRLLWFMLSTSCWSPLLLSRLLESDSAARRPEDGPRMVGTHGSSRSESFLEPSLSRAEVQVSRKGQVRQVRRQGLALSELLRDLSLQ